MVRMMGAVLAAAGAAWMGFGAAAGLKRRGRALEEMADGLDLLALELEWGAPPLPGLMERAMAAGRGPARALFRDCVRALEGLEGEPFSHAWRRLAEAHAELGEEGRRALIPLGDILGRCDSREQQRAVRAAGKRLRELAGRAEEDYRRQGKVYQTLGLSGGAFLVILLL